MMYWRACVIVLLLGQVALAADVPSAPSLAGFPSELRAAPAVQNHSMSVTWENVPLRQALKRLATATGTPILLDRRVDPGAPVRLVVANQTVEGLLSELVEAHSLAVTSVGDLYYVGPQATCDALRTVIAVRLQEASQLPAHRQAALKASAATTWPRLTSPRQLVLDLVKQAGLSLRHAEQIPHDLWPEGELPELSLVARLSILLAGFDLTFAYRNEGQQLEVIPLVRPLKLRASYDVLAQRGVNVKRLRRSLPDAGLKVDGGKLVVEGRWEQHQQLQQLLEEVSAPRSTRRTRQTNVRQVFTLRVREQPLRQLVEQLAERLDFEVTWHERAIADAGLSLDVPVTFAVDHADMDELLRAALAPAGLAFRRDGRQVDIVPPAQ